VSRTPVIAGNWKMNTTPDEGVELIVALKGLLAWIEGVEVIVAPPFTHLYLISEEIAGTRIQLASQNIFSKDSGAYTGEISPPMLKKLGCKFAIIGHSERRQYFGETDMSVNEKAKAALSHDITPIICIGETLDERDSGKALDIIEKQLEGGLSGLSEGDWKDIIIAYEPVWAIGTGKTATNEQAQEVHAFIRANLEKTFGEEIAEKTRIIYGGSVKPENVDDLMAQPDIDGALVGGASLKADSFEKIVKFKRG
jgi:triosephosphate isomerase